MIFFQGCHCQIYLQTVQEDHHYCQRTHFLIVPGAQGEIRKWCTFSEKKILINHRIEGKKNLCFRALSEEEIAEINQARPSTSIPFINIIHPESEDVFASENRTPTMYYYQQKVLPFFFFLQKYPFSKGKLCNMKKLFK